MQTNVQMTLQGLTNSLLRQFNSPKLYWAVWQSNLFLYKFIIPYPLQIYWFCSNYNDLMDVGLLLAIWWLLKYDFLFNFLFENQWQNNIPVGFQHGCLYLATFLFLLYCGPTGQDHHLNFNVEFASHPSSCPRKCFNECHYKLNHYI